MEQGDPPSPAPSNPLNQTDDAFHSGFQQLIQHNAATTVYQGEHHSGSQIGSNPHSRYSSPGPQVNMTTTYGHSPINQGSPYPAPPYQGGYGTGYAVDPSPYPQLPDVGHTATHHTYGTPATSPPTPVQIDSITTRSGRSIMRPSTANTLTRPSRIEKQRTTKARPKKGKRTPGDAFSDPSSPDRPLSILVKDIKGIDDTDIEAYVNRSPEDRRLEVANSKTGKVKRPMNAFMLYRKAYQNRTKEWKRLDDIRKKEESAGEGKPEKGHDNHQVISQVCGASWNIESLELRNQYDEWAKVERNNHKLAFPDYKFAPAKSKTKRSGAGEVGGRNDDSDDNASNLDAYDIHEWAHPGSGPPSRPRSGARFLDLENENGFGYPSGYPQPQQPLYTTPSPGLQTARLPQAYVGQSPIHHQPHPSSFQYSNPGKQRPADYGTALGQGRYYQQNTQYTQPAYPQQYAAAYGTHHQGIPAFVEDVYINRTNSPGSFHSSPILDHHHPYSELMAASGPYGPQIPLPMQQQHHPQQQHLPRHPGDHQIDPSLMGAIGPGGHRDTTTYDSLGILGLGQSTEFAADNLATYQLDNTAGGFGGSHMGSPHPQQFEQAYHTPNETTPAPEGGNDAAADTKIGSTDWETTLGGAEFQIEDIDQFLGTTADDNSPER
ncbi:hypothetical protein GQX73_g3409 [Xylaria multiplex]|uniref:HMG box domain-containing protein n=1 Tax=Xylaria multiplex TaxID=323545 RepID=A0A7C8MTL2_9PEZI|nr:hypothetical protein GQX73_g3409 [Xylaria multiplex]